MSCTTGDNKMKNWTKQLAAAAIAAVAILGLASRAQAAAPVTYSTYTVTSSSDTNWLTVPSTLEITAFNVGAPNTSSTTYGGTTWLGSSGGSGEPLNTSGTIGYVYHQPSVAWASKASGFYSGGPDLLNYGAYWAFNDNGQVDLTGFTIGNTYLVQFVFADTRYDGGTMIVKGISGVTGDSASTTYSYTDGKYLVVNAQFTADTANTTWKPSVSGGAGEQLNGIRVLEVIPEPSTLTLVGFGLLGAVAMGRGFRRTA
jgi:hypothetical protein